MDADTFKNAKKAFSELLEWDSWQGAYGHKLRQMIDSGEKRLIVSLDDLQTFQAGFSKNVLKNPNVYLPAFELAVKEAVNTLDTSENRNDDPEDANDAKDADTEYFVGVEGSFGSSHVTPRQLGASLIGSLVVVEGIVTKCSLVRPKVVKSVHYCEKTGAQHVRYYRDAITISSVGPNGSLGMGFPTSTTYPTKDDQGNPLTTEYGLSVFKDHQTLTIQEMPEKAPAGQLPCSVDVIIEDDLVDKVKPGDRVQICGVYKGLPQKNNGHTNAIFRTVVVANNVRQLNKEISGPVITDQDLKNIKKVAQSPTLFDSMATSLAPSIYGHEYIKKALLLMLLGGVEKNLRNKTHLRGDINILLIGDPSTAKSQLLRFVLHTAPLAISTTGRGASGVGLTAAVVHDTETGERRLEAGAMVLADRGVVCIDEFDKMSVDDRIAIHEVMEQQTVTIAKAGIHTSLNARCSVLAAANPIYGQYNRQKKPTENIALPDSLLSRFDLLFIFLDNLNPETDRMIAEHVLRMHRYRPAGSNGNNMVVDDEFLLVEEEENSNAHSQQSNDENIEETPIFQKFDKTLHGHRGKREIFSIPFIKKYLLYAKNRIVPQLSEEACTLINNAYSTLRSKDNMKTLPITARTLETLIRLATAHAKVRLSEEVTEDDAKIAIEIMNYALFHDAANPDAPTPKPAPASSVATTTTTTTTMNGNHASKRKETDTDEVTEMDLEEDGEEESLEMNKKKRRMSKRASSDDSEDVVGTNGGNNNNNDSTPVTVTPERRTAFQKSFFQFRESDEYKEQTSIELDALLKYVNSSKANKNITPFSKKEAITYLKELESYGIMIDSDVVYY